MAILQCIEIHNAASPEHFWHSLVVLIVWLVIFFLSSLVVRLWYTVLCCQSCQTARTRRRLKEEMEKLMQLEDNQARVQAIVTAVATMPMRNISVKSGPGPGDDTSDIESQKPTVPFSFS